MAKTNFIQSTLLDTGVALKRCKVCGEPKTLDHFLEVRRRSNGRVYRKGTCNRCLVERNKQFIKDNPGKRREYFQRWQDKERKNAPEKSKKRRRDHRLRKDFGRTISDYESMERLQGGVCAICKNPEIRKDPNGDLQPLRIDHDHDTGKIRQLLCDKCNVGLGRFNDDPSLLRTAAEYIERHRQCL